MVKKRKKQRSRKERFPKDPFAEREAAKVPGLARDTAVADVKTIAVVGLGMMGSGIAVSALAAGYRVLGLGHDDPGGDKGLAVINRYTGIMQISKGRSEFLGMCNRLTGE